MCQGNCKCKQNTETLRATPAEIVESLFQYISYMGTGQSETDGVPEDEMMCNVTRSSRDGLSFDGFGSSPFLKRERLEQWFKKHLKS